MKEMLQSVIMESKANQGLMRVLSVAKGPTNLARLINDGITPQAISQWRVVPAKRVLMVSKVTGIACHDIRPDLYPLPEDAAGNSSELSVELSETSSRRAEENCGVDQ